MNQGSSTPFVVGLLVVACAFVFYNAVFTVDERHSAVVFQLGEITDVITTPGLHFKVPFLQRAQQFDMRIQTIDSGEPQRFPTSEKKNMMVDLFIKWRVIDPKRFYTATRGDERSAVDRLRTTIYQIVRDQFALRTVNEVVSGQRDQIMALAQKSGDTSLRDLGVQIVDVRLKRVDYPEEISKSVYSRMEAERKRAANELRSQGAAESERIRADADRQREVIIAEAYRQAESLKGRGDAAAAAIYAKSFGQNPEFFAFYRSMQAYRESFKGDRDVLVVDPDASYFHYMRPSTKSAGK